MRRQRPFRIAGAAGLALALASSPVVAGEARPAREALAECPRDGGTLARYLLCLDLTARRQPADHAVYYAELDRLERDALARLPREPGKKGALALLPKLHHAARPAARYAISVTLLDALEGLRRDPDHVLAADCDLFSFLNAGVAERYYAGGPPAGRGVGITRTRHDHLVNVSVEQGRVTGLLETVDGSVATVLGGKLCLASDDPRAPWDCKAPAAALAPLPEDEAVALYLADVGIALQMEGQHAAAMTYFDAALSINDREFVALVGRAQALFLEAGDDRAALAEAEVSALAALAREPAAARPHALLGRIALGASRPDDAERHFAEAMALERDPVHHYYLALALEAQAKHTAAIDAARGGKKLLASTADPGGKTLDLELDYVLALAHAARAEAERSPGDLRRAMDYLAAVVSHRPQDAAVLRLESWIDRLDHKIGPVHRDFGLPTGVRTTFDASRDE